MRANTTALALLIPLAANAAAAAPAGAGACEPIACLTPCGECDDDVPGDRDAPAARGARRKGRCVAAPLQPMPLPAAALAALGARRNTLCLALLGLAGCASSGAPLPTTAGVRHEAGSTFIETQAFYGIPILRKSFLWDGEGEVDDSGLGVHVGNYLSDQVALGIGSNVATWWTPGSDVYSMELEGLLRIHPVRHWPLFLDGTGGYQLATSQIPPGGTVWNFSFSFGCGFEFPVGESTSFVTGIDYHHISNALGRENDRNPSQNEARIWVGFEWTL